jgi:diguanylate cyclase (GGDEF)-like protein/PAS domain S-box-containing protein
LKPLNILLANDAKSVGQFVSNYLRDAGHLVTYVESGEEAVAVYRQQLFDLVLIDIVMPGIGGLEAVKQIKAIPTTTWVPVIIITALDAEEDILGGYMAGADDYMVKPIKPMVLDIRIRSMARIAAIQRNSTAVIDNVIEGIIKIDRAGRISRFNRSAEVIFGYSEAEVLGKNVNLLMPPPYKNAHDGYLENYVSTGQAKIIGIGRAVTGLRKSGETFPMHLGVTEAATPEGKFFIGVVRDISAEEEAHAQVVASAQVIAERERFIRAITDAVPGMVAYWDEDMRCRFANSAYLQWFGKPPEAVIGLTMRELMGDDLFARNERYIRGVLAGNAQRFERTLIKADGSIGYTWATYIPDINAEGKVIGFYVLVTDITPVKEAQIEAELADSVYKSTVEGITVTDAHGVILSVNPAFTEITGYTADEAIGQNPRLLKSNRHDHAFYASMWQDITAHGRWKGEIWNRRKDGAVYLERMTITMISDEAGMPMRYVSVFNDITDLRADDYYHKHLAFHDALTDLPNRALLTERLSRLVVMAKREQRGLAVIFLDLDRFKSVNDTLGHDVGDDLLKEVAQKLTSLVRQSDTVARLGGDEFVVVLDNPANKDEVAQIAGRIVTTINVPMEFRGKLAQVGTSIGIAMHPADGNTTAELLKSADSAMYAAKHAGKNTFRFFDGAMAGHFEQITTAAVL